MNKNISNIKGFTLIEILVAIAIFSIFIASPTGFFIGALKSQSRALSSQEIIDNVSYSLEYISRALRMAKKETLAPACLSENGLNYEITDGPGIKFVNYQGKCQKFFLEEGRLKEDKAGVENYLTPDDREGVALRFNLSGQTQGDNLQPKVTIFLEIQKKSNIPEMQPKMKTQTTVSQRNLDVVD